VSPFLIKTCLMAKRLLRSITGSTRNLLGQTVKTYFADVWGMWGMHKGDWYTAGRPLTFPLSDTNRWRNAVRPFVRAAITLERPPNTC